MERTPQRDGAVLEQPGSFTVVVPRKGRTLSIVDEYGTHVAFITNEGEGIKGSPYALRFTAESGNEVAYAAEDIQEIYEILEERAYVPAIRFNGPAQVGQYEDGDGAFVEIVTNRDHSGLAGVILEWEDGDRTAVFRDYLSGKPNIICDNDLAPTEILEDVIRARADIPEIAD